MKNHASLTTLFTAALILAGASLGSAATRSSDRPTIITIPAVQNGSNWSRAPFAASRQFDDVNSPNGLAIDKLAPNTPATNTQLPVPAARVAILQKTPAPGIMSDPGLLPTGRPSTPAAR